MLLPAIVVRLWRKWRNARVRARYANALEHWEAEDALLREELATALAPALLAAQSVPTRLLLHRGESILLVLPNTVLIEPRQLPSQWVGGYGGVSLRLTRLVRFHVGRSRGRYVPSTHAPTRIARGTATLTTQRIVFQSRDEAREFAFANLLGYQHDSAAPLTYFQLSNREKVSGIEYDPSSARGWRFALALALASFRGELSAFVEHLRGEAHRRRIAKPVYPILAE